MCAVLSPTFFFFVTDKLLQQLKETSAGLSIWGLYFWGAAHADDIRAIASSASAAEKQGQIIHELAVENSLKLSKSKAVKYRYLTSQFGLYLVVNALASCGLTICQQGKVLNQG